jgi:hypothetical protein
VTRNSDNLPPHIKGSTYWKATQLNINQWSYWVQYDDRGPRELPVEYINNWWYTLCWRDNHYWVERNRELPDGFAGLGGEGETPIEVDPPIAGPSAIPPPPPETAIEQVPAGTRLLQSIESITRPSTPT